MQDTAFFWRVLIRHHDWTCQVSSLKLSREKEAGAINVVTISIKMIFKVMGLDAISGWRGDVAEKAQPQGRGWAGRLEVVEEKQAREMESSSTWIGGNQETVASRRGRERALPEVGGWSYFYNAAEDWTEEWGWRPLGWQSGSRSGAGNRAYTIWRAGGTPWKIIQNYKWKYTKFNKEKIWQQIAH